MVEAVLLCLERPEAVGQSFNIGNARSTVTIFDLAQRIKRLTGCPGEIVFQPLALRRRRAAHPERREGARAARLRGEGRARRRPREDDRVVPEAQAGADLIRLARPDVGEEELAEIAAVLETGQLTMGAEGGRSSRRSSPARPGPTHAVAVSSGTAALHVAVLALGLGPGDEVLVPAYTFPATANVVALAGATPVLVDVDPVTMNIDPEDAARRVTPRTKAVLAVHLFGRPARLEELPELPVLEDAAGALGALAPRPSVRQPRRARLLLVPSAQDRHDRRGRRRHDGRRRARRARALAAPPRLVAVGRVRGHAGARVQLPPERRPLRARHPAAAPPRRAARGARARRRRLRRAARRPRRRPAGGRPRRPARAARPTSSRSTAATR